MPDERSPNRPNLSLGAKKRALLEMLRKERGLQERRAAIPPREDPARPAPCTHAQERLWFLDQLEPGNTTYNELQVISIEGSLDLESLEGALVALADRHEILRTIFIAQEGRPLQRVLESLPPELVVVDAPEAPDLETMVDHLAAAELDRPFDLATGPLWRVRVVRISPTHHLLLLTMHHIVSDGWSLGVLIREALTLYRAKLRGEEPPLADLPIQYADYAVWQRERSEDDGVAEALEYWRAQLEGLPPLDLPTDRPPPRMQEHQGASVWFDLPSSDREALAAVCRREDATEFMGLLALWALFLARTTGQTDIGIGAPVAGRKQSQTHGLIGFFVSTVALRLSLDGVTSFRELVRRAKQVALEGFQRQQAPFERVVEMLAPERSLSRPPLVQALLAHQTAPLPPLVMEGLRIERLEPRLIKVKLELQLDIQPRADDLRGRIDYATALFDQSTVEAMVARLLTLMHSVVTDPDGSIWTCPWMPDEERDLVLSGLNDTARSLDGLETIDGLIDAAAEETPERVAVVGSDETLTYAELRRRARSVAAALAARGVGRGDRVGLCVDRTAALVPMLLGCFYAGAAYIPMDPRLPADRLGTMLEDAEACLWITDTDLDLGIERARPGMMMAGDPNEGPVTSHGGDDVAYVIYTSGSTGRPKGVQVRHRTMATALRCFSRFPGISADDVMLSVTTISFDMAMLELFLPLVVGARALVATTDEIAEPRRLFGRMEEAGVTMMTATPTMFRALVDAGLERPGMAVISAGEALPLDLARDLLARVGRLINGYGPTETFYVTLDEVDLDEGIVTIGRPMDNTVLRVLDRQLELCPVGVVGELYVGGMHLARGYLGRPALTAERFLPDPHAAAPGERLYRTGDRVRWLADGRLAYVGRRDDQLKIRGYRVEPGEVESVLNVHPDVQESAVVARTGPDGVARLVAFVQPRREAVDLPETLRRWVKERLPEYMVPAPIVPMEELPRTSNNKLDRRRLPELSALNLSADFVEPASPLEQTLHDVWADLMGVERLGCTDDFFAIGGHSLLATRLVARLESVLGVRLPVRQVFETPTIRSLATAIEEVTRRGEGGRLPPITPLAAGEPAPLSFVQERIWFLQQLDEETPSYNLPILLELDGELDLHALRRAFDETVDRHDVLRARFPVQDGRPRVERFEGPIDLPLEDLSESPSPRDALAEAARDQAEAAFDLEAGPVIRARCFRLGDRRHVLAITIHHIAVDAWSFGILVRELVDLYSAQRRNLAPPRPEGILSYADYAGWQRRLERDGHFEPQIRYWLDHLADAPRAVSFPADHPRPKLQTHRGQMVRHRLPSEIVERLRAVARGEGATLFMALLSAFYLILSRYSGERDLVVGTPHAGRHHPRAESLVGCLFNTLVLRGTIRQDDDFRALVRRTRQDALAAFAHADARIERLVDALQPVRDMSRGPLFQVVFAMHNAPMPELDAEGLEVRRLEEVGSHWFADADVTFDCWPSEGDLVITAVYDDAIYDAATIQRILTHFERLADALGRDPDVEIGDVSLLDEAEGDLVLEEANATEVALDAVTIPEQIRRRAEREPDRVALAMDSESLRYAELEARADRVAAALTQRGVGRGDRVGVFAERGLDLPVMLLGVMKVGAAYVPLDPGLPVARASFMASDAEVGLVICKPELSRRASDLGRPILVFDEAPGAGSSSKSWTEPTADDAIYVIYTSGSTGRPKGAINTHRNLINRIAWTQRHYRLTPDDVVLLKTPISFDVSGWELWWPLTVGATMAIAPPEAHRDPVALYEVLRRSGTTFVHFVPSMLQAFLARDLGGEEPLSLRQVICSGEALSLELVRRFAEIFPGVPLANLYGPTEAAIDVSYHDCDPDADRVPIGRPVDNTQLHVLDEGLRPLPVGVPGELYIGGANVGRGYVARPGLTAERFVPDPFAKRPGARLYRTGDLVRRLPNLELEYLGRLDQQIKLRGQRLELTEIDAVAEDLSGVTQAVTVPWGPEPQLVTYLLAAKQAGDGLVDEVKAHLADQLPAYMVPTFVERLSELPMTSSGKVDRRELGAREPTIRDRNDDRVAPRDALERVLVDICSEVLGVDEVGVTDSFFELGGHSLLATQVLARVEQSLGPRIPLQALFAEPTVGGLAKAARESLAEVDAIAEVIAEVGGLSDDEVEAALEEP